MTESDELRRGLVRHLREAGSLRSSAVAAAFANVARERFVAPETAGGTLADVYADRAIILKRDDHDAPISSSSQPAVMAEMLEALGVSPGDRVLEIGTASGYNAALLAELIAPGGHVTTVELDEEIAERARAALAAGAQIKVVVGDGHDGAVEGAPYDAVIVTASSDHVAPAWHSQLRDGGRLVVPMRFGDGSDPWQSVVAFERRGAELWSFRFIAAGFMSLRHPGAPTAALVGRATTISVSDQAGPEAHLVQLSGARLAALATAARRRLVATLMELPSQRTFDRDENLTPALRIVLDDAERTMFASTMHEGAVPPGREGVGLVAADGGGAAFVVDDGKRAHIVGFGEASELQHRLVDLVAPLRRRRGAVQLVVSVGVGPPSGARPVASRGDVTMSCVVAGAEHGSRAGRNGQ